MMSINYHSKALLTATILTLCVTLMPIKTAEAALTVEVCEHAISTANNFYDMALKNTKDYPTPAKAKKAADKYFARQIAAEGGTTVINRQAGIDACAHSTPKGKKYYASLFTY